MSFKCHKRPEYPLSIILKLGITKLTSHVCNWFEEGTQMTSEKKGP